VYGTGTVCIEQKYKKSHTYKGGGGEYHIWLGDKLDTALWWWKFLGERSWSVVISVIISYFMSI
jgi:hypothetical protein